MTPLDIANAEIAKLRREIYDLREENRQLRGGRVDFDHEQRLEVLSLKFGVKGTGARIVHALWKRQGYVRLEALAELCLEPRDRRGDEMVLLRNHVKKVRSAIGDASVLTKRGFGYRLSEPMRAEVTAALEYQ